MSEQRQPRPATPFGAASETVAANVRQLRELRGLTIYTLSDALGAVGRPITPSAVAKIERRQRHVTVDDLVALSAALRVMPQQLLSAPNACATCSGLPLAGFACMECGASVERATPDAQFNSGGLLHPAWVRRANRTDRPERVLSYDDVRRLPGKGES